MIKVLLASHAFLAKGMKSSVEMILGKQPNLDTLCAYTTDDFVMKDEIKNRLIDRDSKDKQIVITDVFGGSVNNDFIDYLSKNKQDNIYLVSGMNLGLLLSLMTTIDSNQSISDIISHAIESSTKMIINDSKVLEGDVEEDSEDF